jgi:short-subunit dehydrogenase
MSAGALVTGAAGGIGAAFARLLTSEGYRVTLVDRRREALEEQARALPGSAIEAVDLGRRDELEALADRVARRRDLELLINNAGFGIRGLLAESDVAEQLAMIDVMATATMRLCRAALPAMLERKRGAIINVASIGGFRAGGEWATYGAAKRFVIHFSEGLAEELAGSGVKLQVLCPGFTHTAFHDVARDADSKQWVPSQLWMTSDEVARASYRALDGTQLIVVPGLKHRLHLASSYAPAKLRQLVFAALRRLPS